MVGAGNQQRGGACSGRKAGSSGVVAPGRHPTTTTASSLFCTLLPAVFPAVHTKPLGSTP